VLLGRLLLRLELAQCVLRVVDTGSSRGGLLLSRGGLHHVPWGSLDACHRLGGGSLSLDWEHGVIHLFLAINGLPAMVLDAVTELLGS
jgi:hypothetical protein